jgi:hypothetical protein
LSGVAAAQATRPSSRDRERALQLSRESVGLIERRQLADAEATLRKALELVPDNTTCLYNLACVRAAQGDPRDAMDLLERATDAGFTDFHHLEHDRMLEPVRSLFRYRQLVARKDEIRHRAAERIVNSLKEELGAGYLYDVDEPQKLVFAVHADRAGLTKVENAIRCEAASQWKQVFSHRPDEFIRILVASPGDYAKRERREGVQGRYDDSTRTLLVKRIGPELRHEFTHALHAADQRALDQEHPVWLSEGLASLYENARIEISADGTEELLPNDTWRLAAVQTASRRGEFIPLPQLLRLDRNAFTARATLAYGESGNLLLYLYEQQLLKAFYDSYTEGYAKDATGQHALESVTGKTLPDLQNDWEKWMRRRTAPKKS